MRIFHAINSTLPQLVRDDRGATAIEYGLLAGLIAVAAITAMESLGTSLGDTFGTVEESLGGEAATETPPPAADEPPPVAPAMRPAG